jgi:hypothetical protein
MRQENGGQSGSFTDASKALALIVGLLYIIGLFIVNFDLGTYGLFSLRLDRPEYILVGALWVFLTVAPIVAYRQARALMRSVDSNSYLGKIIWICLAILEVGIVPFFLQFFSDYELRWIDSRTIIGTLTLVGAAYLFSTLYADRFKYFWDQGFSVSLLKEHAAFGYNIVYLIFITLSFLSLYTVFVFPYLKVKYGGGCHPLVELLLSERVNLPLKTDGIGVSADGLKLGPARLTMETEDTVIITPEHVIRWPHFSPPSGGPWAAYALSKDIIIACRFIPTYSAESTGQVTSASGAATTPVTTPGVTGAAATPISTPSLTGAAATPVERPTH